MLFASAAITDLPVDRAAAALAGEIQSALGSLPVDLLLVFFSSHHISQAERLSSEITRDLRPGALLGCSGQGVIGPEHEIEARPAVSVIAASLPGVAVTPFALRAQDWHAVLEDPDRFVHAVGSREDPKLVVLLADPLSTPIAPLLDRFNTAYPEVPVVGGMASGARARVGNAFLFQNHLHRSGAVGVMLSGAIAADVIVSQGCRPIGSVHSITKVEENVVVSLDGRPPLAEVQGMVESLSVDDRELLRHGLFVGRAIDARKSPLGRGDFLIRSVVGVDQKRGTIAVGDDLTVGERIQFHVRDAATAREDLEMMLSLHTLLEPARGALLFSCNGRGTHLYGRPDGDISIIRDYLGRVPLAGFFCAGEFGPIGGKSFLHGHTASLALLRRAGARVESTERGVAGWQ